ALGGRALLPFRSYEKLVRGVVEVTGEAVQRLVAQDVNRVPVVLVARRFYVNGALVAPQPGAGEPRPDERLAEVLLTGVGGIVRHHPRDPAAERPILGDRVDRVGGRAARQPNND